MRFGERAAIVFLACTSLRADGLVLVHAQRYAMGTMFDIVAYHASGQKAERAIEVALAEKNLWLERVYEAEPFDLETVAAQYEGYAQRLRPLVADTSLYVDTAMREGKEVLFEGAQATLLDLDHGTYPFVTSSNPVAASAATGAGIGPQRIDRVVGVSKAYVTRVGAGPFPTEAGEADAEVLRTAGDEFGTTTGRPRRCGWLDTVGLRYAARVNGLTELFLTKLDVLSRLERIPVGRLGTPEDVVGAVVLLASDDADFIAGASLMIDGGQTL